MTLLLLGYGNTLRGDDGVGYAIAEAVAGWQWPHVRVHQLTPELAAELVDVERVIFVDVVATAEPGVVGLTAIAPPSTTTLNPHHCLPATLLHWAAALYGATPIASQILIPACQFDYGETFSPLTQAGYDQAIACMVGLISVRFGVAFVDLLSFRTIFRDRRVKVSAGDHG